MNKKIERIATIALAAFLVGMFIFQVAHATNESDYKYGFKDGEGAYKECSMYHSCTIDENLYGVECMHYSKVTNA